MLEKDKIMKKINYKKIIPGFISLLIVAGMAFQSFATNVDLDAFIDIESHTTKFYELEWRINEIDKKLERMYKFVCTNVRSFAGNGHRPFSLGPHIFYDGTIGNTNPFTNYPLVDLTEQKYLKFNTQVMLINYGSIGKTVNAEYEIPASLCKWRNGIEVKPETKVKVRATYMVPGYGIGSTASPGATVSTEWILGPFKKFPHITSTGSDNGFIFASDRLQPVQSTFSNSEVQYARGTVKQPTSWTSLSSGAVYLGAETEKGFTRAGQTVYEKVTAAEFEEYAYEDEIKSRDFMTHTYVSTVFGTNLSSYENVWLRFYRTQSSTYGWDASLSTAYTITNWNNNK